jgi:hypothetical protein
MEERSQQVLSCKVSPEEADTIKSRAQARGSQYRNSFEPGRS